jgi:hypothetical protein
MRPAKTIVVVLNLAVLEYRRRRREDLKSIFSLLCAFHSLSLLEELEEPRLICTGLGLM